MYAKDPKIVRAGAAVIGGNQFWANLPKTFIFFSFYVRFQTQTFFLYWRCSTSFEVLINLKWLWSLMKLQLPSSIFSVSFYFLLITRSFVSAPDYTTILLSFRKIIATNFTFESLFILGIFKTTFEMPSS